MTRSVLFVDDEQRILDGLRRSLRDLRHDWDLRFALGGEAALDALDAGLTVVVSDMRMPDVDGVEVLRAARERAPRAARVILSGNSDRSASRRAAQVAHRFLAKPCESGVLQALLPALAACTEAAPGLAALGPLPLSQQRVDRLRLLLDRAPAQEDVVALVEQDPALTLTVLHVACCSFFAAARECVDVAAAVEHVGPAVLRELLDEPGLLVAVETGPQAVPHPDPTAGALAGLAPVLPQGALRLLLLLRGLPGALADRASAAAAAARTPVRA